MHLMIARQARNTQPTTSERTRIARHLGWLMATTNNDCFQFEKLINIQAFSRCSRLQLDNKDS